MDKAVLIIIFNRPDKFRKVIASLRTVKPHKLYIAADGPRVNNKNDIIKCSETREIIKEIDWECQIKTLFHDNNVGCEKGVSSAVTWLFENEEDGIILEDDIVPDETFFYYCEKLLDYYKDDERIMHIGNNNIHDENSSDSYYICSIANSCGWASWRRAWKYFDLGLFKYDYDKIINKIENRFDNEIVKRFLKKNAFELKNNPYAVWDNSWIISVMINNGMAIYPNQNLITNIGFDEEATHIKDKNHHFSNLKTTPLKDIKYLEKVELNKKMDEKITSDYYGQKVDIKKILNDLDKLNFFVNNITNKIAWFIPIKKFRDQFRNYVRKKIENVKPYNYPFEL